MNKFRFLDWDIYKDARELFSIIIKLVRKFPKEYRFELGSQVIRSALSIVLNIAEGSGKSSDAELNRFFDIALGSAYETLAAMDVLRYNKLITEEEFADVRARLESISSRIGGFKKKLTKGR